MLLFNLRITDRLVIHEDLVEQNINNWTILKRQQNSIFYVQSPCYNAPHYYADSDITRSVMDPNFLPPGVKWLGCHQSCFTGVGFDRTTHM